MKLLIIQTAFLGDVVLTIPLIQAAKKYLKAQISVVCIPSTKNILEGHPSIDELIVFDKKKSEKSFFSLLKFAKKLKEKKFDVAIIPHPSFKSGLISFLVAIPKRIGFSNSAGSFFFTDKVFFDPEKYQLERYLDLLKRLACHCEVVPPWRIDSRLGLSPKCVIGEHSGTTISYGVSFPRKRESNLFSIEVKGEKTEIHIEKEDEKFADDILSPKTNKIIFGINPGSVWATKRWLAEKYAELSDRIVKELGGQIVIFGGPDDIETAGIVENRMTEKAINISGKTTLKQLVVLIKRCCVFVTNDSGPMHIAASFDIPVVAIFGPTVRKLGFFPYSKNAIVIEKDLSCRPCGKHGPNKCPKKHFDCMNGISVNEVFNVVKRI
ncbi:MAG: glycosyltransferase family 9 protein [Elusimicrobiota bacterium]